MTQQRLVLADSNGRGGKALHGLCDSSWSLPAPSVMPFRDEERRKRSHLSKARRSGASETPGILSITAYRRFLPLTELTKNRVPNIIPWNEVAEQAFTKLKAQLVKAPSLYTPDLSKPYQLYTDVSATAIGACLSQNDEKGKENPIAFFSKKLTETQTRWATIEREAYAVIEALKRFDSWIFGAEIEVISDHNPLTYLTLTTPQSAKLTRWALALQRYNIAISYRKGVKHGNADALSRLPIPVS
ncbi:retrovirus-related Pol polyprotein from transposon opus [Trichonephila clavipes]|nr:retrovirus-related Pol polyprotein from transposon opus [Trichonephila clavipes]